MSYLAELTRWGSGLLLHETKPMSDEEIIAKDLGETLGDEFLFWDRMICPEAHWVPRPFSAQKIVDEYLNEHRQQIP